MTPLDVPVLLVQEVRDGDTFTAWVVIELDTARRLRLRLAAIDTPERGDPGYDQARHFIWGWIGDGSRDLRVALHRTRTGRFLETLGRYVADLYDAETGETVSSALLRAGMAVPFGRPPAQGARP